MTNKDLQLAAHQIKTGVSYYEFRKSAADVFLLIARKTRKRFTQREEHRFLYDCGLRPDVPTPLPKRVRKRNPTPWLHDPPVVTTTQAAYNKIVEVFGSYGEVLTSLTTTDVRLHGALTHYMTPFFDDNKNYKPNEKIPAIKALRIMVRGMGLSEAKSAVENWPSFLSFIEEHGHVPKIDWQGIMS